MSHVIVSDSWQVILMDGENINKTDWTSHEQLMVLGGVGGSEAVGTSRSRWPTDWQHWIADIAVSGNCQAGPAQPCLHLQWQLWLLSLSISIVYKHSLGQAWYQVWYITTTLTADGCLLSSVATEQN